jgi:hypothetical protein
MVRAAVAIAGLAACALSPASATNGLVPRAYAVPAGDAYSQAPATPCAPAGAGSVCVDLDGSSATISVHITDDSGLSVPALLRLHLGSGVLAPQPFCNEVSVSGAFVTQADVLLGVLNPVGTMPSMPCPAGSGYATAGTVYFLLG